MSNRASKVSFSVVAASLLTTAYCTAGSDSPGASQNAAAAGAAGDSDAEGGDAVPMAESGDESAAVDALSEMLVPVLSQLGMGGCFGYAAGYSFKVISRAAMFLVGTGFIALQGLAYGGYIDIKWGAVQSKIKHQLDADGDGELTVKDFKIYASKLFHVLKYSLPSSSGFGTGFVLALKYA